MVNIDCRELIEFQGKLEQMGKRENVDKLMEEALKELAAVYLRAVMKRTPVGKSIRTDIGVTDENGNAVYYKKGKKKGKQKTKRVTIHTGGTLRRGWLARTEQEAEGGGGRDVNGYVNGLSVEKNGNTYKLIIINPVKYASYVNYGHRQTPGRYVPAIGRRLKKSWVKGNFMVEITEAEVEAKMGEIMQRKLDEYIRKCMNDS